MAGGTKEGADWKSSKSSSSEGAAAAAGRAGGAVVRPNDREFQLTWSVGFDRSRGGRDAPATTSSSPKSNRSTALTGGALFCCSSRPFAATLTLARAGALVAPPRSSSSPASYSSKSSGRVLVWSLNPLAPPPPDEGLEYGSLPPPPPPPAASESLPNPPYLDPCCVWKLAPLSAPPENPPEPPEKPPDDPNDWPSLPTPVYLERFALAFRRSTRIFSTSDRSSTISLARLRTERRDETDGGRSALCLAW